MSETRHAPSLGKVPRRHYKQRFVLDDGSGRGAACSLSGRQQALYSRLLAPKEAETRGTLVTLRRDYGLSRGQLAALLAVGESTLKAWENGIRRPSMIARRMIWFLARSLRGEPAATMGDFVTWS